MSDATTVIAPKERNFFGHPHGLSTLFFTEMWERFSYYGMRALLVLFLVDAARNGGFGLDDRTATAIYGLYTAAVYVVALPGGWIADRLIGTQAAALWGGVIIALGHLLLGASGNVREVFYIGLLTIVAGTGLLKPNLSALVAQLYPDGGARRDAGFTIYYMAINIGAFLGPLVTAWLAQKYGWHAGFIAAAVGMILGVIYFLRTREQLGTAGRSPPPPAPGQRRANVPLWLGITAGIFVALGTVIVSGAVSVSPTEIQVTSTWAIVAIAAGYFFYWFCFAGLNSAERRQVVMMLALFLACALFWSGFEQAGSSFNLFAERFTVRNYGAFAIPAGWFQSLNAIFIVIFAPLFSALWVWLGARNLDPSTPVKFVLGLLGMAVGFLIMATAARYVAAGSMVGAGWLTSVYLVHTFGELCLSPVGLSAFTKLAPARFVGQSLGVWFLGTALGNLIAGRIAGEFDANNLGAMPGQLMRIFWFGILSALALLIVGQLINRWIAASRQH
jgi:POT family proton-dependent oligopeptide transporter